MFISVVSAHYVLPSYMFLEGEVSCDFHGVRKTGQRCTRQATSEDAMPVLSHSADVAFTVPCMQAIKVIRAIFRWRGHHGEGPAARAVHTADHGRNRPMRFEKVLRCITVMCLMARICARSDHGHQTAGGDISERMQTRLHIDSPQGH
jgi:hypothetical protein